MPDLQRVDWRGACGLLTVAALLLSGGGPASAAAPTAPAARPRASLAIGVTLHPYYSWTRNIVGDLPGFEAGQATDEVHHRLADGTLLHVSTWMRAGGPAGVAGGAGGDPGVIAEPFARGWVQLLVGATRP